MLQDYIEHVLEHTRNLRWLVDGLNMVPLDSRTLSTLDRLMATFEENESVSGSLMVIGKSVLHSRMPVPEALAVSSGTLHHNILLLTSCFRLFSIFLVDQ